LKIKLTSDKLWCAIGKKNLEKDKEATVDDLTDIVKLSI